MADVDAAIDFVMHQEDPEMTGSVTTLPGDAGGATRYGIASKFHPGLVAKGFFSPSMPNSEALSVAVNLYKLDYAAPMLLLGVFSQDVANHMLSFAVNDGVNKGTLLLQWAINQLMPNAVKADGIMGAKTLDAANRCMEISLLNALRLQEIEFHVSLDEPEFLLGWIRRDLA
ncbi:MAG: putative peptidoglycan-binding domain-containing protein [Acidobacteriaceae bacterium]